MVSYQLYEDKFYNDLKDITLESFELTSFNTDPHLPKEIGAKIAWELWCAPVLKSKKKRHCIVAVSENRAVGYLIYGADASYSKVINKKIGNIILMAVKKDYRGKYSIAKNLIEYALNIFKKNNFDVITVGTDLNNLPALITYINLGFRPILNWSTYRNHFELKINKNYLFEIIPLTENDKSLLDIFIKNISRPNSLLIDKKIGNKDALINYIKQSVRNKVINQELRLFAVESNTDCIGLYTVNSRNDISKIIGRNFYTIYDMVFLTDEESLKIKILNSILYYLNEQEGCDIVEIFLEINDFDKIKYFIRCGFSPVHNATTLHYHI